MHVTHSDTKQRVDARNPQRILVRGDICTLATEVEGLDAVYKDNKKAGHGTHIVQEKYAVV